MPSPTTERSVVEVLRAARERISDPAGWCQKRAVDSGGGVCASQAVVAASAAFPEDAGRRASFLLSKAAVESGFRHAPELNDTLDHPAVLEMFGRAIDLAEAEQS